MMQLKTIKERCPCCNKRMYKLKNNQWTHLFSVAFEETFDDFELDYCKKCIQMTNHKKGKCLKCEAKK